jgi:tRNA modification GTPase
MAALVPATDTIAAIATPVGQGAVGIVRLSGAGAVAVADVVFSSKKGKPLSAARTFSICYGWIVRDKGAFERAGRTPQASPELVVDEVVVSLMRSPHSYTREDVVEINSHGGPRVLSVILELLLEKGARVADPGEFTRRAFLNGRLDLAQAEAVLDIIQAKSDLALKNSLTQLSGELSRRMKALRRRLVDVLADIEARLDFSEEELSPAPDTAARTALTGILDELKRLLEGSFCGRIIREGLKVVIYGRPNVGKSSLLNALLKTERAIVTAIAGTTRDTIEECVSIKGLAVCFVDTAGILEAHGEIERLALERTRKAIDTCGLLLFVLDGSMPLGREDERLLSQLGPSIKVVGVVNKSDLPARADRGKLRALLGARPLVEVSAMKGDGMTRLEEEILKAVFHDPGLMSADVLVSNVRHIGILKDAVASLERSIDSLQKGLSPEFAAADLRRAADGLGELTGEVFREDVLDVIFSKFCIGK